MAATRTGKVRSLFPKAYHEAMAELRKPDLEIVFRRGKDPQPSPGDVAASWKPILDRHRHHIDHLTAELRALLDTMPALQAMTALVVTTAFHDPETFRESATRHSVLHAEYVVWHYLTTSRDRLIEAPVLEGAPMQHVFDLLDEIVTSVQSYYTIQSKVASGSGATSEDDVRIRARSWHLFVRGPSYERHNRDQLTALFVPFEAELHAVLGFGIDAALKADAALTRLVSRRLNDQNKLMVDTLNDWESAIRQPTAQAPAQLRKLVAKFKATGRPSQAAQVATMTWAQSTWHFNFIVTPGELAEEAGLDVEVAAKILAAFSTPFGQPRRSDDWPSVEDQLEQSPLVDLGDGRYWVGLISKLEWAFAPRFEEVLRRSDAWERYQNQHRRRWLENRAVTLIAGADERVQRFTRLRYGVDDELDGLILVGGTAILVEAKGGRMSREARRGAPSVINQDLKRLLGDAQAQLTRAGRYVFEQDEARFQTDSGEIVIRREDINRRVDVIVTLDSLTAFVSRLPRLADAGVFDETSLPWCVDINDLDVLVDLLGTPARLVHYIDRRMRAARRRVEAPEELDYLGHYLTRGLFFDELPPDTEQVLLTSHTELIDAYYSYRDGHRKTPTPKPTLDLDPIIAELIAALEASACPGFGEAVFWLLEMSRDAQADLGAAIEERRRRAGQGLLTAIRFFLGKRLIVYMATPDEDLRPLEPYVAAAKYVAEADQAVGIAQAASNRAHLSADVQYYHWTQDAATASWAADYLANFMSRPVSEADAVATAAAWRAGHSASQME